MTPDSLVLLHGFAGGPTSWDDVVASLPPSLRIFRPALLGHDRALSAPAVASFDDEVDRLAAVVRAEGLGGARLAGYSMGGRVALGLLARHPGLFGSAVIVGARAGLPEHDADSRTARQRWDDRWAELLEREGIEAFVEAWERLPRFATQARLPAQVRARHRARRLAHDPAGLARAMRVLGLGRMPCLRGALPRIGLRVRVVAGALDHDFVEHARAMAAELPRSDVRLLPACGHDPLIEQPRAVAAALTDTSNSIEGTRT